ncbi:phage portal protein [Streptosporangium amethystogenes subsp. fukuiense]|uniref:Phage portal protein n=1 Tax=Streptosporangium amethystogenes subsp. fukuiense TaxID=698418 RepID=A0ABW2T6F8_9ACTN
MAEPQMDDEVRDAVKILNRLADELRLRETDTRRRLDYYRGVHKLCYASPEFRDYFADRFAGFSDNWCAPVAAAPAERMNVLGIRLDADETKPDEELSRAWRAADCERGSSEAFVVTLAAARSYCLVWADPTDDQAPRVTWERPDQAIVGYDTDTGARSAALKLWSDDTTEYATLYTPDWVWKFSRPRYARTGYSVSGLYVPGDGPVRRASPEGWQPRQGDRDDTWPIPNPMGVVPMVELRNQTLLDDNPISDIDGVIAMQDAINLTWAYLMNSLDFASLPQRVVMGADVPKIPVLNSDGVKVGERPIELDTLVKERILWLTGDAKIGNWPAADLGAYSNVIERAIEHLAAQTRTPPHYLIGKVANLSAEALTAAETGLVSKTGERIVYVNGGVREIHSLMANVMGDDGKAKAARSGTVMWGDVQFRALAQKVDALMKLKSMGFPLEWIAEQYGLEPPEVARVLRMREAEMEMDPMALLVNGKSQIPASPPTVQPDEDPFAVSPDAVPAV